MFDFDLNDVEALEDVSLTDASEYQDQTDPAPLNPGNWALRVVEGGRAKDKDGNNIDDEGFPVIVLNQLEIVEPEEFKGRQIYPFAKYSFKPIAAGKRAGAVPAVDLLRAFDDSLTFANRQELAVLLAEQIAGGNTFRGSTNWEAKDSDYIREQLDAAGGFDDMDEDARRELFKVAIIRGQKKFPKVNGSFVPEIVGPSGDKIQARVKLTRLYPSSKDNVKLGEFGKKQAK